MNPSDVLAVSLAGISLLAAGMLVIVGVIELVKALVPEPGQPRNWRTAAIIVAAGVTGGLLAKTMQVEWIYGVYVGLSATGLVKITKGDTQVVVQPPATVEVKELPTGDPAVQDDETVPAKA